MLDVKWNTSSNSNQLGTRENILSGYPLKFLLSFKSLERKQTCIKFHGKDHEKPDVNGQLSVKSSFVSFGRFSISL